MCHPAYFSRETSPMTLFSVFVCFLFSRFVAALVAGTLLLRLSLVRFRCASRAGALSWRLRGLVASTAFWVCSDPLTQSYFCSITHIAAPCWPIGHTYSPEPSVGIHLGVTSDLHACRIFLRHSSWVDCTCQAPCPVWHLCYLTW